MKISRPLQIVTILTFALSLQSSGRAQGNLVNLYENWTIDSVMAVGGGGPGMPSSVDITSPTSAIFHPGWANNPLSVQYHQFGAIAPVLSRNLDTTAGTIYEITFTLFSESALLNPPSMSMSFGDSTVLYSSVPGLGFGAPLNAEPLNINLTAVAASPITLMSFTEFPSDTYGDFYNSIYISNLSVMAVPETSATRLFGFGGCILLLLAQVPKWIHPRKPRSGSTGEFPR